MNEEIMRDVISVNNLVKRFGNFTAVDHISFKVRKGEIFGLLGANGAGKTTTIKMLCGLLSPTEGSAVIDGVDAALNPEIVKYKIGYMSQKFSLYPDLSVWENFRFYGGVYGMPSAAIKERFHLLVDLLDFKDKASILTRDLPLGWRQKLAFMVATFHNPSVVFLDEPTSGVDPIVRRQFWDQIYDAANQGTTVLLTTHYMDEALYCDRIAIMSSGRIEAMGKPSVLMHDFGVSSMQEVFLKITRKEKQT